MNIEDITLPECITTNEAAALLRRSGQTLRRWSCEGTGPIQPVRLGRRGALLWRVEDIRRVLAGEAVQDSDQATGK